MINDSNRKDAWYQDPFLLNSNLSYPRNVQEMLRMAHFLYLFNPQLRQAMKRIIGHFANDVDFVGDAGDDADRARWKKLFDRDLQMKVVMREIGEDYNAYGTAIVRLQMPFYRMLIDTRPGPSGKPRYAEMPVTAFPEDKLKFNLNTLKYQVELPVLNPKPNRRRGAKAETEWVDMAFYDRINTDPAKIRVVRLNPLHVYLQKAKASDRIRAKWRLEPNFLNKLQAGDIFEVNETPKKILEVASKRQDMLFHEDAIFLMTSPTPSGISEDGWSLPETIANYRAIRMSAVYRRADEHVAFGHVHPLKIISFAGNDAAGINAQFSFATHFKEMVNRMMAQHRQDPNTILTAPFNLQYQEGGGNAKQYSSRDSLLASNEEMLDGAGIPLELFRSSLTIENAPMALRVLEQNFYTVYASFRRLHDWLKDKIVNHARWPQIDIDLRPPSMADDIDRQQIYLQLLAQGEISRKTAYAAFKIDDPMSEIQTRIREDQDIQLTKQKLMAEYQTRAEAGSMNTVAGQSQQVATGQGGPGGGSTGPGGGSANMTPLQVAQDAEQKAAELLQMPTGERMKAMKQLEAGDENMYAMVKQKMEEIRQQGASMGRANALDMVSQQQG